MRLRFFLRFSLNSLRYRKQRMLLAFGALAVAAALCTVMLGIYSSVAGRLRNEFRNYGANLVATDLNGGLVPLEVAEAARETGANASPYIVIAVRASGRAMPVLGVKAAYPYWRVEGSADLAGSNCLVGSSLAEEAGIHAGQMLTFDSGTCAVSGIVSAGGAEDGELILPFERAAAMAGVQGKASAIEIAAAGDRVEQVKTVLSKRYPAIDFRTVRSVAETESNVVIKMRAALLLLTLLILAISVLCVASNFGEMVIDRAKEIGIMKALGGAEAKIAAFFLSESAGMALAATLAGYGAGVLVAAAIGTEVFGGAFRVSPDWAVAGGVVISMLVVSLTGAGIAVRRIRGIQPAVILRGE